MPLCGGCRTCEIACSFHHKGEFSPSASSIKILEKKKSAGFDVFLAGKNEGTAIACDRCQGLRVPLCVEYCTKKDELNTILNAFFQEVTPP
jgi:Fe-S-cluster-containing hydrogenase component 2